MSLIACPACASRTGRRSRQLRAAADRGHTAGRKCHGAGAAPAGRAAARPFLLPGHAPRPGRRDGHAEEQEVRALVGFHFAIAAFLLAYNGLSRTEIVLSKTAAAAALGVALFPCRCGTHTELVPYVHGTAAAVMFLVLACLCYGFYRRARGKGHSEANARATIYALCGIAIVASIVVLAFDSFSGGALSALVPRLTYFGEATGLVSFGVSWLTASRVLPVVTRRDERFSPFRERNPE